MTEILKSLCFASLRAAVAMACFFNSNGKGAKTPSYPLHDVQTEFRSFAKTSDFARMTPKQLAAAAAEMSAATRRRGAFPRSKKAFRNGVGRSGTLY